MRPGELLRLARDRTSALQAAVAGAVVVVTAALVLPSLRPLLVPLTALAAATVALVLRPRLRGIDRAAWLLAGVGQIVLALVAMVGHRATAPGAVDAAVLAGVLLQATAVVALLLARVRPTRARLLAVDASLVTGSAFVVAWVFGWQRAVPGGWLPPRVMDVGLGRVSIAVELVTIAVGVAVWVTRSGRGERLGPRLMVAAAAAGAATGSGLLSAVLGALGLPTSAAPVGWVLASALLVVGPVVASPPSARPHRVLDHERALVPVVLLVGTAVALAMLGSPDGLPRLPLVVAGAVMLVLLARLLDVARTNQLLAQALAVRERHFRSMVDTTPDVMLRLSLDGRISYVSPSAQRLLEADPALGRGLQVADLVPGTDAEDVARALQVLRADAGAVQRLQVGFVRRSGTSMRLEAIATRVGSDIVVAVRDVTETMALREQLVRVAYTDQLTSLPNRAAFDIALSARFAGEPPPLAGSPASLLAERRRSVPPPEPGVRRPVVVLFCDLDGFKPINDSHGHDVGDLLLVETGRRIAGAVRGDDIACRLGGDEFTVLMGAGADVPAAVRVAGRVRDAIAQPFAVADVGDLVLGVSIGVASADGTGVPSDLVRDADVAMYQAKHAGRGQVKVFEPQMHADIARSVDLVQRLHSAVADRGLSVVYQPVIDLRSGAVVSAEALLRWRDGDETVAEADEVIALAEASGDIHAIGAFVLEEAVGRAAGWAASGYPVRVAVNLSAHQLSDPDLVGTVERLLVAHGVPADRLMLEITESALVDQTDVTLGHMESLRGLGVHLAVDDFGTGYSSLDYLRRLPIDQIKIDRSFLDGFGREDDVTALVRAVIALGHELGLTVTVEGVECGLHVRLLREAGVANAQGYAFARALDVESMQECLRGGPFTLDVADDDRRLPRVADRGWPVGPRAVPTAAALPGARGGPSRG